MNQPAKTHGKCPYTDCGHNDCFTWFGEAGKCHSCDRTYPMKNMPEVFDWARQEYPLKPMRQDYRTADVTTMSYKGIRGIDEDVAKLYGIQLQSDANGPVRYAFKYPDNVKYRGYDEKKFWTKGGSINDFFGPPVNAGTSKKLYLTEGEFDAASLYQAMGKSFPVLGLPSSSLSDEFFKKHRDYLASFQQIIYAGELDQAGRKCADRFYAIFPERMLYVPMTKHKDANDFLQAGDVDDLKWAALKPQRYSPENFFMGDAAVETAILTENPYEYTPTGHDGYDKLCRGLVRGGITFIKAPRGSGKTEICRFFELSALEHDTIVALLHMEEQKSTTYRAMATYELGVNVRTKDDANANGVDESKVIEAAKKVSKGDNTIIFEMRSHDDPLQLLEYVRLAATVYGASYVFIDHVQRLAYLSATGVDGATSTLTTLGARMAQLCKELNIGVIFASQVNDDGRTKYAASLEEEALICVDLERNVESEDEVERNTTNLNITKNRPFSRLGNAGSLFFDIETMTLREEM